MSNRPAPAATAVVTLAALAFLAVDRLKGAEDRPNAEPEKKIPFDAVATDPELKRHREAKEKLLGTTMPGLDLERVTLSDAIDAIRDTTKVNIFVNWRALEAAGITRETRVSITLKKVTLGPALQLMLDMAAGGRDKLGVTVDDGVVTISTADDISRNTLTRVYDARDLARGADGRAVMPQRLKALERLLMNHVEPKSWRDNGGDVGAIRELDGQFIVTQTPENQAAVGKLLADLRHFMHPEAKAEGEGARGPARPQQFPLLPGRANREPQGEAPAPAE